VFWPRKAPGRAVAGAPYAGLLSVAWAYVEKVRTQFLSLRQLAPQPRVLCVEMLAISPVFAAISDLDSGPLNGGARPFFSEWLNSLPSSGLRGFGTVLEIPTFRRAYEFQRKEVLRLLSDRREHPNPIRHIEVRILPPQPGSSELGENVCDRRRKARQWRVFANPAPVSGSGFGHSQNEMPISLQRTFEKLPFLGDCGRRPGSICSERPSLWCKVTAQLSGSKSGMQLRWGHSRSAARRTTPTRPW
jgi:hypothetical protein